jgi:hypothetical protein
MRARPAIALSVAITMAAIHAPATLHAEETAPTELADEAPVTLTPPDVLALTSRALATKAPGFETARARALFANEGSEIRLSSGAKTAIIVTAIVVGVLLIVFVVGRPHRHL